MQIQSLKDRPLVCDGCKRPLSLHRIVTTDKDGNPVRFNQDCDCYQLWAAENITGFVRRAG